MRNSPYTFVIFLLNDASSNRLILRRGTDVCNQHNSGKNLHIGGTIELHRILANFFNKFYIRITYRRPAKIKVQFVYCRALLASIILAWSIVWNYLNLKLDSGPGYIHLITLCTRYVGYTRTLLQCNAFVGRRSGWMV